MSKSFLGYILVIISGVLFGINPIFTKTLYAAGMNVFSVLTQRNIMTILLMYLLIRFYVHESIKVTWSEFKRLFIIALFANLLTSLLLQTAYLYLPSGMATTLHFVYPVVTMLEGAVIFREKLGAIKWLGTVCCTLGIVMFYTPGGDINAFGMTLALASGITFGTYMVLLNHIGLNKVHSFKIVFYNSFFGLIFHGGYALFVNELHIPLQVQTLGIGLLNALLSSVLASSFLQFGIRIIGAQRSAILSTCEPLTSTLLGIIIFHDHLDVKVAIGIFLILIGVVSVTVFDRRKGPETDAENESG